MIEQYLVVYEGCIKNVTVSGIENVTIHIGEACGSTDPVAFAMLVGICGLAVLMWILFRDWSK